eukprot:CAMPEP_0204340372 /NCGR_PEP_ID=MMETSP0469-20131031/22528_1 /ASSEMBLY_ACC=CAM_ASM_000384 /TAXON_ID=2969 /ORGANISM="Oxyrrhis marina" /LENGTH=136 /DNA_ID=CAMNT_0051324887 /DNA_START=24 /DNA_END=434 /DNA_ORIENTATION=-
MAEAAGHNVISKHFWVGDRGWVDWSRMARGGNHLDPSKGSGAVMTHTASRFSRRRRVPRLQFEPLQTTYSAEFFHRTQNLEDVRSQKWIAKERASVTPFLIGLPEVEDFVPSSTLGRHKRTASTPALSSQCQLARF